MKLPIPVFALFFAFFVVACGNDSTSTETDNTTDSTTDTTETTSVDNSSSPSTTMTGNVTGTYLWGDQEGEGGGGYLAIEKQDDGSLKFELDITNGAPNYHTGTATGTMPLDGNVATFETTEFDGDCKITFTFNDNSVEIKQVSGNDFECGFGQGVVAQGTYTKDKDEAIFKYEGGMQ